MVVYCVAYNCKSRKLRCQKSITFHTFPFQRPDVLKMWVKKIRRKNWQPTIHSCLCSKHFAKEAYAHRPGAAYPLLKDDAVPTIFDYTIHNNKTKKAKQNVLPLKKPSHTARKTITQPVVQNHFKVLKITIPVSQLKPTNLISGKTVQNPQKQKILSILPQKLTQLKEIKANVEQVRVPVTHAQLSKANNKSHPAHKSIYEKSPILNNDLKKIKNNITKIRVPITHTQLSKAINKSPNARKSIYGKSPILLREHLKKIRNNIKQIRVPVTHTQVSKNISKSRPVLRSIYGKPLVQQEDFEMNSSGLPMVSVRLQQKSSNVEGPKQHTPQMQTARKSCSMLETLQRNKELEVVPISSVNSKDQDKGKSLHLSEDKNLKFLENISVMYMPANAIPSHETPVDSTNSPQDGKIPNHIFVVLPPPPVSKQGHAPLINGDFPSEYIEKICIKNFAPKTPVTVTSQTPVASETSVDSTNSPLDSEMPNHVFVVLPPPTASKQGHTPLNNGNFPSDYIEKICIENIAAETPVTVASETTPCKNHDCPLVIKYLILQRKVKMLETKLKRRDERVAVLVAKLKENGIKFTRKKKSDRVKEDLLASAVAEISPENYVDFSEDSYYTPGS